MVINFYKTVLKCIRVIRRWFSGKFNWVEDLIERRLDAQFFYLYRTVYLTHIKFLLFQARRRERASRKKLKIILNDRSFSEETFDKAYREIQSLIEEKRLINVQLHQKEATIASYAQSVQDLLDAIQMAHDLYDSKDTDASASIKRELRRVLHNFGVKT